MLTGIAVTRARDHFGVYRHMSVLVDGREVGAVPYGGRDEFALEPGVHSVQVAMDWCRSSPHEVRICAGEVAELEGGLRWRGPAWCLSLLAVFVAPGWVFVVRPVPARLLPATWWPVADGRRDGVNWPMSGNIEYPDALPSSTCQRFWAWCRRNRVVVSLAACCLLQLVGTLVVSAVFTVRAVQLARENRELRQENQELRESLDARTAP